MVGGASLGDKIDLGAAKLKSWTQGRFGKIFADLKKKTKALKKLNHGGLSVE